MTTNRCTAEKSADEDALESRAKDICHDAYHIATDAEGALHFWSPVHRTVIVFEHYGDTDPEVVELPTPEATMQTYILDLGDWREYISETRGWDECRIDASPTEHLLDRFREALE